MSHVDPPGTGATYLYHHALPDVCLVSRGDTIVTVYSREICKRWQIEGEKDRTDGQRNDRSEGEHHSRTRFRSADLRCRDTRLDREAF